MQDYAITKCTKKCAVSGRPLEPGENYVSVLLPDGEGVKRIDVAASAWTEPDAKVIGWWRSRMPNKAPKRLRPAPNGILLDTLSQLLECPGKESLSYLLALLLVRRRVLIDEEPFDGTREEPQTCWALTCPADGRQWNVPVMAPSPDVLESLQQELNGLLFTEE